jgi:hypothetical protein
MSSALVGEDSGQRGEGELPLIANRHFCSVAKPTPTCAPSSSSTRSRWRFTVVAPTPGNTPRCCSPNAASRRGSKSRWAAPAIVSTTPAARRSTRPSRRNASTGTPGRPGPRTERDLRVHRGLVQPPPPTLDARLPVPDRVRASARRGRPTGARGPDFGQRIIGRGHRAERRRRAHNAPRLDGRRRFRGQPPGSRPCGRQQECTKSTCRALLSVARARSCRLAAGCQLRSATRAVCAECRWTRDR